GLAGGIAHDFNNLLCVIPGYCDVLRGGLPEDGRWQEQLREVRRAADRASALTRQLLAFSRRQNFLPRALDVNSLVVEVEGLLRRLLGEDVELVTQPAPGLPPVRADRVQ